MIISFSGPDGIGKTTQIQYLLSYFANMGVKCCSVYDISPDIRYHNQKELITYYRYFQTGDVIHTRFRMNSDINNKIINELENTSIIPNKALAMSAAKQGYIDACEWFDTVINPLQAKEEKILIFDRYFWDEIAFKTFYGCSLKYMENLYCNMNTPQLSLIGIASTSTIKARNSSRPDGDTTLYKSSTYIRQLNNIFTQIAKEHKLQTINMEGSPIDIHKKVVQLISPLLASEIHDMK